MILTFSMKLFAKFENNNDLGIGIFTLLHL